jgi:superfamily II DNA or RNA helicase
MEPEFIHKVSPDHTDAKDEDEIPVDSFRSLRLRSTYSPDNSPFEYFYVPLLKRAVTYERAVGYWSAAELQFAAQGTAHFIANGGRMRLIVGAQLDQRDVEAVMAGRPIDAVVAARLLADPDLEGTRIIENEHLSVLAWMVATDRLELRVGIPKGEDGRLLTFHESGRYFHTKYGVLSDRYGNQVAFNGSNNASVSSWLRNHETFDVFPSWNREIWNYFGLPKVHDFEDHWKGSPDAGWAVIDLPTAVKQHLTAYAPEESPLPKDAVKTGVVVDSVGDEASEKSALEKAWNELVELRDAPQQIEWTGVGTAWAQPLPHQAALIQRVVSTYPRGYLFADEVGLGKTIEAGMVLRELFTSRKASNALLLVPSSVMKQWQEELYEKMNLHVVRYDKGLFYDRHDKLVDVSSGANPWSAFPIVLASSHLARRRDRRQQLLDAGPWDVVLVDEAHHARRRGSKPTDTPNSLLQLLLDMRDRDLWKALYLATATPMQMHPHEAWDLISLLGLPGKWGEQSFFFTQYFTRLNDDPKTRGWKMLCEMLADYFSDPDAELDTELKQEVEDDLGWAGSYSVTNLHYNQPSPDQRAQFPNDTSMWMDRWLRRHTPMRDRVFRNTRLTMRRYQEAGIIPESVVIPRRRVEDEFISLAPNERKLYERIEEYIRRHYNAYLAQEGNQALGFIMTIYRRRLTSSFKAIKQSLVRRLSVLQDGASVRELLTPDDSLDVEESLFEPEIFDIRADRLDSEIVELKSFLRELEMINGEDSKATKLIADIHEALFSYSSVVVFTQYVDTMDYIRERLRVAGYQKLGCYSGRGGEIYDSSIGEWVAVTKADIKERFRAGELEILIGTDSMSEGLNLQTAGRLINYDMPWNLMRVEQRIGRVDRIGAAYETIWVSNYFYSDTVEEQVYRGIARNYGDFTNIVGDASPVLADVENVIETLALGDNITTEVVSAKVDTILDQVNDIKSKPIQNSDFESHPAKEHIMTPPDLTGQVTLSDLEDMLTTNILTGDLFIPAQDRPNIYRLIIPAGHPPVSFVSPSGIRTLEQYSGISETNSIPVTFKRQTWDISRDEDLVFLTYGTPELAAILPASEARAE